MNEFDIEEIIVDEEIYIGDIEIDVIQLTPELEDLEVTPSAEEQNFKSTKYGYDNVTVKAVESEKIEIVPSTEEQIKTGLFSEVRVAGSENLVPENIKKDVDIFGVVGTAESGNAEIMTYQPNNSTMRLPVLITKIPKLDTANITNMDEMFLNCQNLIEIPVMNTDNVVNMRKMFSDCRSIEKIPMLNTSNVTRMDSMFYQCFKLTEVPKFDISKITDMSSMFYGCRALKEIPNFDTKNITKFGSAFYGSGLESIHELNCEKVTIIYNAFGSCRSLVNMGGLKDLGKSYTQKTANYSNYSCNLSYAVNLTHESLMNLFNSLHDLNLTYDVANGGTLYTQQLIIGPENTAKLTAEELNIPVKKGWTVS